MKCDICNEYEGSERQVTSHKIHCAKKHANPDVKTRTRETDRKERIPFGVPQKKLHTEHDEDERYQTRVFNDNWAKEPGRVQRAIAAGYEPIEGLEHYTVGTNEDGTPIKGVKMRIPKELYEEDQKEKRKEIDKIDEAIQGGTLEQQASDRRYTPQGIKIHSTTKEP